MNLIYLLKNFIHCFQYDLVDELNDCQRMLQDQSLRLLYLELMNMPPNGYEEELAFIRSLGFPVIFPYPSLEPPHPVEIGISSGFPFVLHGSRRLYFPKNWTRSKVEKTYRSFVEQEYIIGQGEKQPRPLAKTPHQYMGGSVQVEPGDVVIDIGAAEGLFSLNIAERASKIVLIENDSQWFAPLERTFEPFQDKTVVIRKAVGDRDSRRSIRLSTALRDIPDARVFVKMDIEGAEVSVINASRDILASPRDIRWACCTYHRANDADALEQIFHSEGYRTEFSDGWMLFLHHRLAPPFFRHGIIRAWKNYS